MDFRHLPTNFGWSQKNLILNTLGGYWPGWIFRFDDNSLIWRDAPVAKVW
jgi:hypothetical protein